MNWQNIWLLIKSDYPKLLLIMALAFYMAFIPHLGYPYPVHVDEWLHLAHSQELMSAGSISALSQPFYKGAEILPEQTLESGFHIFWGAFQQISGLPWMFIIRYFPGIVFMITVISVYILARRQGFGWEAAFFASLILTTVGILGPAFLVPMSLGLLLVSLSIFIAFNFSSLGGYVVLFLFTCFLLIIHPPSAICLVIILVPYILLNLKGNFKRSLGDIYCPGGALLGAISLDIC